MKNEIEVILATTLSVLLTFILYNALNETKITDTLFQHLIVDCLHPSHLFLPCLINQRNITACSILLETDDSVNEFIGNTIAFVIFILMGWYGFKVLRHILPVTLMTANVWLLARLCDNIYLWHQIDVFTIYFIVWQISYLMCQWCMHELSWASLILHKGSICVISTIITLVFHELYFRYSIPYNFVWWWLIAFDGVYACLHPRGRFRDQNKTISTDSSISKSSTFPCFCYYTHDIENENDTYVLDEYLSLDSCDFCIYNLLLIWVLPPLASIEIQLFILFGFIISLQIGMVTTGWLQKLWDTTDMPGTLFPVITISAYAIILDVVMKNFDTDCVNKI